MGGELYSSTLAGLNAQYWWARGVLTLAVIWLFVDLARSAPWAQVGLKIALAATCITVGVVFYGLFLPQALPETTPVAYRVWLHRVGSVGLIVAGLCGIVDAPRNGTTLVIPERGWRLLAVVGGVVLGLGFPALELVAGHVYPDAQTFGIASAPLVIVLLPLLGASRPLAWTGQLWFWLMALAGLETGLIAPILGLPHSRPMAGVAVVVGVALWLRPAKGEADMIEPRRLDASE